MCMHLDHYTTVYRQAPSSGVPFRPGILTLLRQDSKTYKHLQPQSKIALRVFPATRQSTQTGSQLCFRGAFQVPGPSFHPGTENETSSSLRLNKQHCQPPSTKHTGMIHIFTRRSRQPPPQQLRCLPSRTGLAATRSPRWRAQGETSGHHNGAKLA